MIAAKFSGNEVRISGHADFCPGNDILCAGVSAIAYALLGYLINLEGCELEYRAAPGDFFCKTSGGAEAAFQMAEIGIRQIAAQYPEYVTVASRLDTRQCV